MHFKVTMASLEYLGEPAFLRLSLFIKGYLSLKEIP